MDPKDIPHDCRCHVCGDEFSARERTLDLQVRELAEACERLIKPNMDPVTGPRPYSRQQDIDHAKGILLKLTEKPKNELPGWSQTSQVGEAVAELEQDAKKRVELYQKEDGENLTGPNPYRSH